VKASLHKRKETHRTNKQTNKQTKSDGLFCTTTVITASDWELATIELCVCVCVCVCARAK